MIQNDGVAGEKGDAGLEGGFLEGFVVGKRKGEHRDVGGGAGFFDAGDGVARPGMGGEFREEDERFFALALLLEGGGIMRV